MAPKNVMSAYNSTSNEWTKEICVFSENIPDKKYSRKPQAIFKPLISKSESMYCYWLSGNADLNFTRFAPVARISWFQVWAVVESWFPNELSLHFNKKSCH